eukprot:m.258220 g.258220  ORF g.258220 m.258220 type:complete len:1753 (+) comp15536_c3_seq7:223-5481(+)
MAVLRFQRLLALAIFLACFQQGLCYVYKVVSQEQYYSTGISMHGDPWQSFTPSISGEVSEIQFVLRNLYYSYTINMEIRTGDGSGGTLLGANQRTYPGTSSSQFFWRSYTYSGVQLTAGTKYSMVLKIIGSSPGGGYYSNVYSGGNAGRYGRAESRDYAFRVFYTMATCQSTMYASGNECLDLAICQAGSFVSTQPTSTTNRGCSSCTSGYTTTTNQASCTAWTTCSSSQYQSKAPTSFSDRVCQPIRICTASEYETKAPTETSNRECQAITVCNDNTQYETTAPTTTSDRECTSLTTCLQYEEYETVAKTATTDRQCETLSTCDAGQQTSVEPTATTDRQCEACPLAHFKANDGNEACSRCHVCQSTEYVSTNCTLTSNTACTQCFGTCLSGRYKKRVCSEFHDDECIPCLVQADCQQSEYIFGDCNPDSTQGPECLPCHASCLTCTGGALHECTSCPEGTALLDGECVSECGLGMAAYEGVCVECHESCGDICIGPADHHCQSCYNAADGSSVPFENATFLVLTTESSGKCVSTCPDNHYKGNDTGNCELCKTCFPGSMASTPCTQLTPRECTSCVLGVTFQSLSNQPECISTTKCKPGEEQVVDPQLALDRECSTCAVGEYQPEAEQLSCLPITRCDTTAQYESTPQTASTDAICSPLTVCDLEFEYEMVPATYTSNRICTNTTVCPPGQYVETLETPTSDAICRACANETHQPDSHQLFCHDTTQCSDTEYISTETTSSSDRKCTPLTVCDGKDEWILVNHTLTSDRVCSDTVQHCVTFSDEEGYACETCKAGYWLSSSSHCEPCPRGHKCEGVFPQACPMGYYQAYLARTTCQACEPGTMSNRAGLSACAACRGATYQPSEAQPRCLDMPSGAYGVTGLLADSGEGVGYIGYEGCEPGFSCSEGIAVSCPAGTYTATANATECLPCGPLHYSPSTESDECYAVANGWYGISESQEPEDMAFVRIAQCPFGSYCVGGIQYPCPAGTFQSQQQSESCVPCGEGRFNDEEARSTACDLISEGYYGVGGTVVNRTGQLECPVGHSCVGGVKTACPPGSFQSSTGSTFCVTCTASCPNGLTRDATRICDPETGEAVCNDIHPPTATLKGARTFGLEAGSVFPDPGASCFDERDGNFGAERTTTIPRLPGTYTLVYLCTDAAGLSASVTRTLVVRDTVAPSVSLNGSRTVRLLQFDEYEDEGALVTDAGDPSPELTIEGLPLDTTKVGEVDLVYTAVDASGNSASVTRSVEILDISIEEAAIEAATTAYEETLKSTGSEAAAAAAARRAYLSQGGAYDVAHAVELASSGAASASRTKASMTTTTMIIVIVVCVTLIALAAIFVLRARKQPVLPELYQTMSYNPMLAPGLANTVHPGAPGMAMQPQPFQDKSVPPPYSKSAATKTEAPYYSSINAEGADYAAGYEDPHGDDSFATYAMAAAQDEPPTALYGGTVSFPEPSASASVSATQAEAGVMYGGVEVFPPGDATYDHAQPSVKATDSKSHNGYDTLKSAPHRTQAVTQSEYGTTAPLSHTANGLYSAPPPGAVDGDYADGDYVVGDEVEGQEEYGGFDDFTTTPVVDGGTSDYDRDYVQPVQDGPRPRVASISLQNPNSYESQGPPAAPVREQAPPQPQSSAQSPDSSSTDAATDVMHLWCQPGLNRAQAGNYLKPKQGGEFIIRKSSQPGSYALTVKVSGSKMWNGLISPSAEGYTCNDQPRVFDTLAALVAAAATPSGALELNLPRPLVLPTVDYEEC